MKLVESHIIKYRDPRYQEFDHLSFKSKNLYNQANYRIRQAFVNKEHSHFKNYNEIQKELQDENQVDYRALPSKVSQQVLKVLDKNWEAFFKANEAYQKDKSKFTGRPKLPKYKKIQTGRNILIYTIQAISKPKLKQGIIKLSGSSVEVKTKVDPEKIKQVRVLPRIKHYIVEVVYEEEESPLKETKHSMGIDLGVNNLCAIATTTGEKLLINGKPLKSINHYYNKKRGSYQSQLPLKRGTSFRIQQLTNKRNYRIKHKLHQISRFIISYCLTHNIGRIIVGKNDGWKLGVNIGKVNNQNFVSIPHSMLIEQIQYKAKLNGITVKVINESYTSKCSFIDNEPIKKHQSYAGKRIKRGLFRSKDGYLINADINAALNILRKVIPEFNINTVINGVKGTVVYPLKVTF